MEVVIHTCEWCKCTAICHNSCNAYHMLIYSDIISRHSLMIHHLYHSTFRWHQLKTSEHYSCSCRIVTMWSQHPYYSFFAARFNHYVHYEVPLADIYCKRCHVSFVIVLWYNMLVWWFELKLLRNFVDQRRHGFEVWITWCWCQSVRLVNKVVCHAI